MTDPNRQPGKRDDGNPNRTDDKPGRQESRQDADANPDRHSARTAGTNRDFDESGESRNQGHGHPREERS